MLVSPDVLLQISIPDCSVSQMYQLVQGYGLGEQQPRSRSISRSMGSSTYRVGAVGKLLFVCVFTACLLIENFS